MGYDTRYKLSVELNKTNLNEYDLKDKIVEELTKLNVIGYALNAELEDDHGAVKWYNSDKDMTKLSKQIPDVIFKLEGEGEERDDNWRTFYMNGKSFHQTAKIAYEKLNRSIEFMINISE